MKTTKRLLATLLALLLALVLLAPAMAAEDPETINEKKLPEPFTVVFTGSSLKLEIDVEMSTGGEKWELTYAWYNYEYVVGSGELAPPIAVGAVLDLPVTLQMASNGLEPQTYSVVVSRVTVDDGGEPYAYAVRSYPVSVVMIPRIIDFFADMWAESDAGPFVKVIGFALFLLSPMFLFDMITLLPFMLLIRLFPGLLQML